MEIICDADEGEKGGTEGQNGQKCSLVRYFVDCRSRDGMDGIPDRKMVYHTASGRGLRSSDRNCNRNSMVVYPYFS